MNSEQCPAWERLNLELELLSTEDPNSILGLVAGIEDVLTGVSTNKDNLRRLQFFSYQIQGQCEGLAESDRLNVLNNYFFDIKKFHIYPAQAESSKDLLLSSLLESSHATSVLVALLYLHLANDLDLPVYFINAKSFHVLKWIRGSHATYIDLSRGGAVLSEDEVIEYVNKNCVDQNESCLDILPAKMIVKNYVGQMLSVYQKEKNSTAQRVCLDLLLKLEPNNLKYLHNRALVLKMLGERQAALGDLQRYFSFTEKELAPSELVIALHELDPSYGQATSNNNYLH